MRTLVLQPEKALFHEIKVRFIKGAKKSQVSLLFDFNNSYVRRVYTPRFCLVTTKIWSDGR